MKSHNQLVESSSFKTRQNVCAALRGEPEWNILYQQYYPSLCAISLKICGNNSDAADAVQDAFVYAYLKLDQLKDPAAFGSWIKTIVQRNCYRLLHKKRKSGLVKNISSLSNTVWENEIDNKFEHLSAQSRLYSGLAKLSETLRSTLLLRYFSDFPSYEEIAAILSVPVGTVRSRLNEAKLKLTQQWQRNTDADAKVLKESNEWNEFYASSFRGMHKHDDDKRQFIGHLQTDIKIVFAGAKIETGYNVVERLVQDDREAGSWFQPTNVYSCGNISIVEAKHFNSPEHPHRCPETSVSVLYREKGKAARLHLYLSQ